MKTDLIEAFFRIDLPALNAKGTPRDDAGYALPAASLAGLREIVDRLGVTRVFEFGSGASTRVFLESGRELSSLEDSESWLTKTRESLAPEQRPRWWSRCAPLERIWHRGALFMSWRFDAALCGRLAAAELVLIDSPALPPFREHALILSLRHARQALIIVDDANIPTVRRFCERLATRNALLSFHARLDHGLYFIFSGTANVDERRSAIETLKALRRFALRGQFAR